MLEGSAPMEIGVLRHHLEALYLSLGVGFSATHPLLIRTLTERTKAQENRSRKEKTIFSTTKPFSSNLIFAGEKIVFLTSLPI